jgi:hypothetical protein
MTKQTEAWTGANDWAHPELLAFLSRHAGDSELARLTEEYKTNTGVLG